MPWPRHAGRVEPPQRVRERRAPATYRIHPAHTTSPGRVRDHHRRTRRIRTKLPPPRQWHGRIGLRPTRRLHRREAVEVDPLGNLTSRTPSGSGGICIGKRLGQTNEYGLLLLRLKPGRAEPVGEIGRLVVPVQLPLHRQVLFGEDIPLSGDESVQFGRTEILAPRGT